MDSLARLRLRPGRATDVPAMYELDLVCFAEPFRFDLRSMRRFATQKNAIVVVADDRETLRAFVILSLEGTRAAKIAYIATVDVHPELRRRGVATQLMVEAERLAVAAGAGRLALHVSAENSSAIAFYERLGFLRAGRNADFYAPGMDAWTYSKVLERSRTADPFPLPRKSIK